LCLIFITVGTGKKGEMKISEIRVLRGPNYWSINHKVIAVTLDIEKFEDLPSDRLPFFTTRLVSLLPGLMKHGCSKGSPGGFIERLRSGTWMGHIAEHIAIEIQNMAGMECSFGQTRGAGVAGLYNMVFEYVAEQAGVYAAHAAIRIAEAVADGEDYDVSRDVSELRRIFLRDRPGPSTESIIKAAGKRNIPFIRLDTGSFVQVGYGCNQKRIEATITENTGAIAVDLASDKNRTKGMLLAAGLPVPEGMIIYDAEELDAAIMALGFPLAVKPNDGNQGKGVSLDIRTREHAISSFENAKRHSKSILIEKY
jgi:cyanophycin synthetase